jgi:UDP-N-acetyl-D-glucosamine dehydrogenase
MTGVVSPARVFDERIAAREAAVGIVGLGYAGLLLAMVFAEAGFQVTGVDVDEERVRLVRERRSYLVDVPAERLDHLDGRLSAVSDYAAVRELDAVTICVPTPLSKTRTPDISYIVSAAESVAANLRPGQLVVLQSTSPPGTTEDIVLPILERGGGRVGGDFSLGYAPERVDPGNKRYSIRNTPKLVAGLTAECRGRTELLYRQVVEDVIAVSSTMVAETAKLHENTFRAVNIALANELALMCDRMGISAWEVIEAASSKPFGFLPHYPGPGLGGDCIPVVPHFLAWRLREYGYSAQLIAAATRSTRACPGTSSTRCPTRSTKPASRSRDRACCSWAWPTSQTFTTLASRPASRCCASSRDGAAKSATATPGSTSSSSTASSTRASTGPPERRAPPTASSCSPHTANSSKPRTGTRPS